MSAHPLVRWTEDEKSCSALWRSESATPPPSRVVLADEHMSVEQAYGLASQGYALLWRADYHHARRMLLALARRIARHARHARRLSAPSLSISPAEAFHLYRQARAQRARTLSALLMPLNEDYRIPLPRAPDVREACLQAYGVGDAPSVTSLRALLGVIGAYEWRKKGIEIPAIGGRIHPHYGVFAPVRSEYVDLVASATFPVSWSSSSVAFDIGTGTGVLAAVLARRGAMRVIATDQDPRALTCARANIARLGLQERVEVVQADLFPQRRATLVVCNPPWIPARPTSAVERAIYDPGSHMLLGFLAALSSHLEEGGEGWLILSDLAEHLGLRSRAGLLAAFEAAGLRVVNRTDVRPQHPRAHDKTDPLHVARMSEVTSLWRLACLP